jgi:hypothetical protein
MNKLVQIADEKLVNVFAFVNTTSTSRCSRTLTPRKPGSGRNDPKGVAFEYEVLEKQQEKFHQVKAFAS